MKKTKKQKQHECEAAVVACIDFRFQKYIRSWLDKNLKGKKYDYIGYAGATRDLEVILKQIEISKKLHQIKKVILIHHEECGAYGKEDSFARHLQDLKKARNKILSLFPDLKINLYYLHLDGIFKKVN